MDSSMDKIYEASNRAQSGGWGFSTLERIRERKTIYVWVCQWPTVERSVRVNGCAARTLRAGPRPRPHPSTPSSLHRTRPRHLNNT
jgi:hypothetical protein